MLQIGGRQIETVAIVDDDTQSRSSLEMCINDSKLSSYPVDGPLEDVVSAHELIASHAQVCICDHHLQTQGRYAHFSGAQLAALNNQHNLPSVLCTRYLDSQMLLIRGYLKDLPVLRRPEQLEEPDDIVHALEACASELNGTFTPERRAWRTQIVVEELDSKDRTVSVSLPAWQVDDPVRLRIDDVPVDLQEALNVGYRRFVRANIGTIQPEFLYVDWQTE